MKSFSYWCVNMLSKSVDYIFQFDRLPNCWTLNWMIPINFVGNACSITSPNILQVWKYATDESAFASWLTSACLCQTVLVLLEACQMWLRSRRERSLNYFVVLFTLYSSLSLSAFLLSLFHSHIHLSFNNVSFVIQFCMTHKLISNNQTPSSL